MTTSSDTLKALFSDAFTPAAPIAYDPALNFNPVETTLSGITVRYNGSAFNLVVPKEVQVPRGAKLICESSTHKSWWYQTQETDIIYRLQRAKAKTQMVTSQAVAIPALPNLHMMSHEAAVAHILQNQHQPHACLGLKTSASAQEIDTQYRTLAKRFHPDKCVLPMANIVFQTIQAAVVAIRK